ncbi:MAG: hypothetical protein EZS28_042066 [Streblomastix strix]|uniref:Uncharacterized protein n=1 Tax=Streblomastix strix TaxID=222440 RepID=A0A5J4TVU9_9EUKA|nr:MAG: hypothetical protein EZS28_042066 [Streblomastix strix]
METIIEIKFNEAESEQVDQQIEKRSVGRPKKYFNDDDRKEEIRKRQLATKRRYAQKKAQIFTLVEIANLFLIASAFDVINELVKGVERDILKKDHSEEYLSMFN